MEKQLACNDVVPGCGFTAQAATEQELMKKVAVHAHDAHGVQEVSPELTARLKAAIQER